MGSSSLTSIVPEPLTTIVPEAEEGTESLITMVPAEVGVEPPALEEPTPSSSSNLSLAVPPPPPLGSSAFNATSCCCFLYLPDEKAYSEEAAKPRFTL